MKSRHRNFQDSLSLVGLAPPMSDNHTNQSSSSDSDEFETTLKQLSMLASSRRTGNDHRQSTKKRRTKRQQRQPQRERSRQQYRQQSGSTESHPRDFQASESMDIPSSSRNSNGAEDEAGDGPYYVVDNTVAGFIQPEGLEIVNQLPEDVCDLTKDIPFPSLPAFFDSMATELEDVRIPDAQLQIAELEGTISEMQSQEDALLNASHRNTVSGLSQISNILATFRELEQKLQDSLLHGCLDQCRSALRQLSDRKLYRRHKENLTKEQRRQIRGSRHMEVHELRMDALELCTDEILARLKRLKAQHTNDKEQSDDHVEVDNTFGEADSYSSAISQGNYANHGEDQPVRSERSLRILHPHMYATRVREENDSASFDIPERHKSKRLKQRHRSETYYSSHAEHKAGESQRGGRKQFRDRAKQRLENSDADDNPVTHANKSDKDKSDKSGDERSNRISEHLFGIELPRPATSFRSGHPKNQEDETVRNHASSGPNRRSIAERMQSFLNANESLQNDVGLTSESNDRNSLDVNVNEYELNEVGSAQNETATTRTVCSLCNQVTDVGGKLIF
jgi:hypothetical protein